MKADYSLYLVTDCRYVNGQTITKAVEQALLGGCTMVQLREKDISALEFYETAAEVKKITDRYCVPLIINNRMDIALAVGAAGVHVGQRDLPAERVRQIIGNDMLLGVSVVSTEQARAAVQAGADYLGVGAMFPTDTKPDAVLVSMEELMNIRRAVDVPIVVIGGIQKENMRLFASAGIDGFAVVSAILGQPDIRQAAAILKSASFHSVKTAVPFQ